MLNALDECEKSLKRLEPNFTNDFVRLALLLDGSSGTKLGDSSANFEFVSKMLRRYCAARGGSDNLLRRLHQITDSSLKDRSTEASVSIICVTVHQNDLRFKTS